MSPDDRLQGTLDLLVLRTLADEPLHGWAISRRIRERSGDVLQVNQGSLYPALHRLEKQGWVKSEWKQTENNQRAKFYNLTAAGRKQLAAEQSRWHQMTGAIAGLMNRGEA
jgi:PadR family transcriptional regulator PadR